MSFGNLSLFRTNPVLLFTSLSLLLHNTSADDSAPYLPEEAGPHHQRFVQRDEKGRVLQSYVNLETGMNRWSEEDGRYVPAVAEFEIDGNVAVARRTQHKAILQADVNHENGTFEFFLPEGGVLRGQCIGIALTETTTGRSIFVGELKSSIGEVVGSDEVLYRDAFDEIKADVRYRIRKGGIAQDVVLREKLPSPAEFGFDPNVTVVEVWTEFLDLPPAHKRSLVADNAPGLQDCLIDFGAMQIGAGKAFSLREEIALIKDGSPMVSEVPVRKTLDEIQGLKFLIEAVPFSEMAVELQAMHQPEGQVRVNHESLKALFASQTATKRATPVSYFTKRSKKEVAAATPIKRTPPVELASSGYVIDFDLGASVTNYTFQSDTTYYASGLVSLHGTTTFEGGTVIKYSPTNTARLAVVSGGTVKFPTNQWRPVIFTARDDNAVGATISGSSNSPSGYYANPALSYSGGGISAASFTSLRISHAKVGLDITGVASGSANQTIAHAQFVNSDTGLKGASSLLAVRNALFYNVNTNLLLSSTTNRAEHLTANKANSFFHNAGSSTLFLTNSIVIGATNLGTFTGLSNVTSGTEATIFQEVGAAKHYLASGSTLRNGGTTNINSTLAAELRNRTTYPPLVLSNVVLTNVTTLWPQASRDVDTPDLGYHYDPLDHVYISVYLKNATLTLNPGVVLGSVSSGNMYGLNLGTNSNTIAEGTPTAPVRFVRYASAQEQATFTWTDGPYAILCYLWYEVPLGIATLKFTEWMTLGGAGYPIYTAGQNTNGTLPVAHSQVFGGFVTVTGRSLLLTNNLLERCQLFVEDQGGIPLAQNFRNNTFWRGAIDTSWSAGTNFSFLNNVFDQTQLSISGLESHNYNGYQSGYPRLTVGGGNGANDTVSATAIVYTNGTLGTYYHATTNFVNRGSSSATNFGLFHFTVQNSNVKETNSFVDLGYHYVAATNGVPFDYDQDGTPDYLEDSNGDGIVNGSENSWTNYNSINGLTGIGSFKVFTPLK